MEENNSELYQELVVYYYSLRARRQSCLEHINVLEAEYKALDEQLEKVHDILCKRGNYIYEHFEEEKPIVESEN